MSKYQIMVMKMKNQLTERGLEDQLNTISIELTDNSTEDLRQLFDKTQNFLRFVKSLRDDFWPSYGLMDHIVSRVRVPDANRQNIEDFCAGLTNNDVGHVFANQTSGYFLSALINHYTQPEDVTTLDVSHLREIGYIGHQRHGKVVLNGRRARIEYDSEGRGRAVDNNFDSNIGAHMEGGELEINGDVMVHFLGGNLGAYMKGGRLILNGNTVYGVGDKMEDGEIIVNGQVVSMVGMEMKGGYIEVNGDIKRGDVGRLMKGGMIVVNGDVGDGSGMWRNIGAYMEGGEIHLNGENVPSSIPASGIETKVGKIYHKGQLLLYEEPKVEIISDATDQAGKRPWYAPLTDLFRR